MEKPGNPESGHSAVDWMNFSRQKIESLIQDQEYDRVAVLIKMRFTGIYKMLRNDFEDLALHPDKEISDEEWLEQHRGLVQECLELSEQLRDQRIREHIEEVELDRLDGQINEFEEWQRRQ